MMRPCRRVSGLLAVLAACMVLMPIDAVAQTSTPVPSDAFGNEPAPTNRWRVGAFLGGATNSPITPGLGQIAGRDHLFMGLQAQTTVLKLRSVRISYGVQLLPAVIVRGKTLPIGYEEGAYFEELRDDRNIAYAFGFSPFGLEVAVPIAGRVSAYGTTSGGLLLFTRSFPVRYAQQANFFIEYGGGVMVRTGPSQWIQAGYKFHHLSNAYRAIVNPGLDANVFYVSYWRRIGS
jgi:hypothetical protein